ncbi:MAG: tyrosine-type recombinase/integrase [Treponema sp.]|jgi:integrase|nr:tyrosine-type recombinase/integrase [Treponema sp.]
MWVAMLLVFNDTGSRMGEVRTLTWKDIDNKKRFIPIRKGVEAGTINKIKDTKTGIVKAGFLSSRTIHELDIWRTESQYNQEDDFVFTVDGKKPVSSQAVIKVFRRGLTRAGIDNEERTPYWLRHLSDGKF